MNNYLKLSSFKQPYLVIFLLFIIALDKYINRKVSLKKPLNIMRNLCSLKNRYMLKIIRKFALPMISI